jgi:hypothetical protein
VFVVTAATVAGGCARWAKPGDLAQKPGRDRHRAKADGWLVDFWLTRRSTQAHRSSWRPDRWAVAAALTLGAGTARFNLTGSVRATDDAVEASSNVPLGAGTLRVTTSYRLDGDLPRLLVTTRFEHIHGGKVVGLSLGDAVKWGNVDYFVEGVGRTPATFSGTGRWVGRRGASGDLVLRSSRRRCASTTR